MKALLWIRFQYLLEGWRKVLTSGAVPGEGKKKSNAGKIVIFSLLLLYAFSAMLVMIVWFCTQMSVFVDMGLEWLYFSLAFLGGAAVTMLGSVYSTQNQLYNARDNELLLAMPVKMEHVCLSRVLFLLLGSAAYLGAVTLSALIVYWVRFGMTLSLLPGFLITFICVLLICQTISCVLGWLLHLLLAKIPNKAVGTLLFVSAFMCAYFWVYSRIMAQFENVLGQFAAIGADLAALFTELGGFFIWLGQGVTGSVPALLLVAGITIPAVVLGYLFMIATFRSSLLRQKTAEKAMPAREKLTLHSPAAAICIKECRRFFTCSIYLSNMGLGLVFLLMGGIAAIVCQERITDYLSLIPFPADWVLPLCFLMMFGFLQSMNTISAPSISLEGRSLWIPASLPLDGWTILSGKLLFHVLATVPLSVLVTLVLGIVYGIAPVTLLCLVVYAAVLPLLSGICGLLFGLLFPRFDWLNEAYPCKQSMAVLFTMLTNMVLAALSCGMYLLAAWLTSGLEPAASASIGALAALLIPGTVCAVFYRILKTRGSLRMEEILRS